MGRKQDRLAGQIGDEGNGLFGRLKGMFKKDTVQASVPPPAAPTPKPVTLNRSYSQPAPKPVQAGPVVQSVSGGSEDRLMAVKDGKIELVVTKPEETLLRIEKSLADVSFGMSLTRKIKEYVSEVWSVAAPIVLMSGTVGEVYFFISSNMEKGKDGLSWWVVMSIIATILALEVTFMVVSMKSDTIRNDIAEKDGGSAEDQRTLRKHKRAWFMLAAGVAIGQVAFLCVSLWSGMDNPAGVIAFSVGRSVFTLAADYYVAFIHKEMPTSAEQKLAGERRKAAALKEALEQENKKTAIINDGIMAVNEAYVLGQIRMEEAETLLETKRLQNKATLESIQAMQAQASMMNATFSNMLAFMFGTKELPANESMRVQRMFGALGPQDKEQEYRQSMKELMQATFYKVDDVHTRVTEIVPQKKLPAQESTDTYIDEEP